MPAAAPPPPSSAGGVRLRPWRGTDVDALLEGFGDPVVQRFSWSQERPYSRADAVAYLRERAADAGPDVHLAVVDPADDRLLGGASLFGVDRQLGTASVGYWLAPAARGRGIATAVVRRLAAYAFHDLELARVELTCEPSNAASRAVARRAGFREEGVLRAHTPFRGGRRDTVVHALLAGEPSAPPEAPALRARRVDPRTATGLVDRPAYRVDFWAAGCACDEWLVEDADDVHAVLDWARRRAGGRDVVVQAVVRVGTEELLVRLTGRDPAAG